MRTHLIFAATCALLLAALPVLAQPPAETCGAGDSLTGMDMLPFDQTLAVTSNDFTMTGTGCNEQGFDHVTCLTPTNSCSIQATCSDNDPPFQGAGSLPEGLQFSVNVFQGTCTTSPASCLGSVQGTGTSTITGVALTAGTTYCFVCERGDMNPLRLELQEDTPGACGSLPVTLQTISIE